MFRLPPQLTLAKINKNRQNPQDTCSEIPGRVFSEGAEPPEAGHHQSHSSGGTLKPVKMSMISQEISTFFFKNVGFSKSQTLNLEKCMIYSREIEVFKCHYAHFAHIRLSFGCTDEKIGFHIYLHTLVNFMKFPNLSI